MTLIRRTLRFILVLALLVNPVGADAQTGADALHKEGFALQKSGDTDAALAKYKEALALDPDHIATLYEIGWSYYMLADWKQVVATWERVLELAPDHGDAKRYLPGARSNLGLTERADRPQTGEPEPRKKSSSGSTGSGRTLRLAFGGDTMMGSARTRAGLPPHDGGNLLSAYQGLMREADVAFLNLEGTLADSGRSTKCRADSKTCYAYRSPTRYVKNLTDAGIDVVSLANNHFNDYGESGRLSTIETLRHAKIRYSGPIGHETILDVGGTKLGVIAFSTSVGQNSLKKTKLAAQLVRDLDRKVDIVMVSFHGGAEGAKAQHVPHGTERAYGENRGDLRKFTHAVVDAGADLVIGHGPHVLRGMEFYKDRLVAYSLGNFVTYGGFNLSGPSGLTALLIVEVNSDGRFTSGRIVAGRQVPPGGPILDPDGNAVSLIRSLSESDFGKTAPRIADDGAISVPR